MQLRDFAAHGFEKRDSGDRASRAGPKRAVK